MLRRAHLCPILRSNTRTTRSGTRLAISFVFKTQLGVYMAISCVSVVGPEKITAHGKKRIGNENENGRRV